MDSVSRLLAGVALGGAGAAVCVLVGQAAWVKLVTPQLPAPDDDNWGLTASASSRSGVEENSEVRLALVGDSPVEGVGCASHEAALAGQTARALAARLEAPVQWRALGRRGLTAAGVEAEMVPLLREFAGEAGRGAVDIVVVSAGVNNVLGLTSAARFQRELDGLLAGVRAAAGGSCLVLVLGLPDFGRLPFLPWPLNALFAWRGRALEAVLAGVAEAHDALHVTLPDLASVAESRGIKVASLLAADGFHPEGQGCTLLGDLLAAEVEDTLE